MDFSRKVKNIFGRLMSDKNICVHRYIHKIIFHPSRHRILKKHRHTIELNALYQDSRIAEIVAVIVKPFQTRTPKAKVVIPSDKDLIPIWQIAEPFHKIKRLRLSPRHRKIPRMNYHIANVRHNELKRDIAVANGYCLQCGGTLTPRQGKYGKFYGCFNYPRCKYTTPYR